MSLTGIAKDGMVRYIRYQCREIRTAFVASRDRRSRDQQGLSGMCLVRGDIRLLS